MAENNFYFISTTIPVASVKNMNNSGKIRINFRSTTDFW